MIEYLSWYGELPKGWEIKKISWISSLITQGGNPNYSLGESSDQYRVLKTKSLYDNQVRYKESDSISKETYDQERKSILKKNDLLIAIVGSGSIGKVNLFNPPNENIKYIYSRSLGCIRLKSFINEEYIKYFFHSIQGKNLIDLGIKGSTGQEVVQTSYLSDLRIPIPFLLEQKLISQYLDKKTTQIDSLVEKTEKKIELLNEQKTALINQYLIKGIDTNVEMKDSGVEWIGKIPKHWKVLKFKYVTELITCGHASTPEYVEDGIMFLSAQNVKNGSLDLSKFRKIKNELHSQLSKRNKINRGDLLQVRVGATIGETCIINISDDFSIYVSLSHIKLNYLVHNNYIKFLCNCSRFREFSRIEMKQGGGVPNLNVSDLERYKIPIPPKSEQEKISNFLQEKTDKIDEIIKKLDIKKNHLNEYRQSLISSVVTGKIRITEDMI